MDDNFCGYAMCNYASKKTFLKLINKLIFLFPGKENIKFDVNTIVTIISLLIIHTPTVYITVLGHIPQTTKENLS